jgi:cyclomaltodextrinase / maltogenic alpha-amylase / neopullulanase
MSDFHTPDWVKDAVFYQIFPDRFAKSNRVAKANHLESWESAPTAHGYKGGDLLGVVEHLDHIKRLGANAVYFCPVFQSGANHRYHTHDYMQVDPMLGGNSALDELVAAAHGQNIKIVLDGVFNHASRGFFQFHDILENGDKSAYLDWFHVSSFPVKAYGNGAPQHYQAWWGMPALPKFNTKTQAVRELIWNVAEHWINIGIDGWRLDVPNEIDDDDFWREFRRRVKNANQEAYIVGEIWEDAGRWLQGDQFDAVMNYPFTRMAMGFFGAETMNRDVIYVSGLKDVPAIDAPTLADRTDDLLKRHPWQATLAQLNLLDSHDTPRFISCVSGDVSALKLATLYQMTFPGAPCIYYGDEIGIEGHHDPDCRRSMVWDEGQWNHDLFEYMQKSIQLRHDTPALRRGSYRNLYANGKVIAFEREHDGSTAIVIFNADTHGHRVPVQGLQDGHYREYLSGRKREVTGNKGTFEVHARSGIVLVK